MPIYEYECSICGERFEAFRGINDDDGKLECPVCGGKKTRRIISRIFGKGGTGWGNLSFPT